MQKLLGIEANSKCFVGFPHPFQDESFKRQTVGRIGMLGEERGDVLESVLELARIDGVPNGSDPPLRNSTSQPELGRHWRGLVF